MDFPRRSLFHEKSLLNSFRSALTMYANMINYKLSLRPEVKKKGIGMHKFFTNVFIPVKVTQP